ncbi:hypothetical protein [Micromonospora tulbaghiae]
MEMPGDDADELSWLLFHQERVLEATQARRFLSEKAIRHRLGSGRWRQVHRRVYVTHNGPVGPKEWRWVAVLAAGPAATLGGLTAAQAWGLRRYESRLVHLLLPARHQTRTLPPGVRIHRTTALPSEDVLDVGKPRRTMPARSLVDAAQRRRPTRRRGLSSRQASSNAWSGATTCIGCWNGSLAHGGVG